MRLRTAYSAALSTILLFGGAAPALAFYDSLTVIPTSPRAGQPFNFSIRSGERDGVIAINEFDRDVAVQGTTVRVTVRANVQFVGGLPPFATRVTTFGLPPLSAGNYRLEVFRRAEGAPNNVLLVQAVDFVVVGALAEPVPAIDGGALFLLVGALLGVGLAGLRRTQ